MAKLSKRMKAIRAKVTPGKFYPADEAFNLLKELSSAKFREAVDVAVNLGVDPRKSDQVVRSATVLPHGTGKTVRVENMQDSYWKKRFNGARRVVDYSLTAQVQ